MTSNLSVRFFTSYAGIKLPLKLVNELDDDSLDRRITYFKAYYDENGRYIKLEKIVYSEIEFTHDYEYHPDGSLSKVVMIEGDENPRILVFDQQGNAVEA